MINQTKAYHIPVLADESLEGLQIRPEGTYVDVTFGGGGHSGRLLERLGENGRLFGFDQDADAESNIIADSRFVFVRSNFRYLYHFMRYHKVAGEVDGLLADLGVSSHHFDEPERGFSFRFSGKLDMRMNASAKRTAADVINSYNEEALADVFYHYGELKMARQLASLIVKARKIKAIETSDELIEVAGEYIRKDKEKKLLAQLFQGLRIEVNDEMEALKEMLTQTTKILKHGGRIAVITYHSIEDRLVKNFFRTGNFEGDKEQDFYGNFKTPFRIINNRVITPSESEMSNNPRSRSAKLRIVEYI